MAEHSKPLLGLLIEISTSKTIGAVDMADELGDAI
jgi:hypothetical protein